jgi:hypothetical protein
MKRVLSVISAVLMLCAFTCASFAATAKKVGMENPENAKQAITKEDKAKMDKAKTNKAKIREEKTQQTKTK